MGGHVEECLDCGRTRIAYNSCRNRHCPKCQALTRAAGWSGRREHLLPVEYYHVVFTLPREVADLALANPAVMYDLLLQAAAATLRDVAANPKHLGAQVGMLLVLHTWGQNLHHHPHVHAVVTGGGLSCDRHGVVDASPRWVACRPGFFLPVQVLSRVFRGKFLAGLQQPFEQEGWSSPHGHARERRRSQRWLVARDRKEWVVYAKPPVRRSRAGAEVPGPVHAPRGHQQLPAGGRGGRPGDVPLQGLRGPTASKVMTLSAEEFLRRFVQHVLPKGFVKIRHYGLLANRCREERLHPCRRLLLSATVAATAGLDEAGAVAGAASRCPRCGGGAVIVPRRWRRPSRPRRRPSPRRATRRNGTRPEPPPIRLVGAGRGVAQADKCARAAFERPGAGPPAGDRRCHSEEG